MLHLSCDLNEAIKEMGHRYETEDSTHHVVRISTVQELMDVESDIQDPAKRVMLVSDRNLVCLGCY